MAKLPFPRIDTSPFNVKVRFAGEPSRPFAKHKAAMKLSKWEGNDADLLIYASVLSGFTPEGIAHDGAVARAKTILCAAVKQRRPAQGADSYAKLAAAYARLVAAGVPKAKITPERMREALLPEYTRLQKIESYLAKRADMATAPPGAKPLRVTVWFDGVIDRPFATLPASAAVPDALRQWLANDAAVVRCASEISGEPQGSIIRVGAVARAKTLIAAIEKDRLKPRRLKPTHGIIGSADRRLDIAYAQLVAAGVHRVEITPTRLGQATKPKTTGYRTARAYLENRGLLFNPIKRQWTRRNIPPPGLLSAETP